MRMTVEIADTLMRQIRKTMARRSVSFRSLVEKGLRRVVEEEDTGRPVQLPDYRFDGEQGFTEGVEPSDLPKLIQDLLYGERSTD